MPRHLLIACALVGCAIAPLRAQGEPLPFHRGQWGAVVNIGNGFAGGGFLHFRDAAHAWILDAGASYQHSREQDSTGGFPSQSSTSNNMAVSARLGTRAYHSLGNHADRQFTFGVTGSYDHSTNNVPGNQAKRTDFGAGVFAELGAEWLVTPHLGLGASWAGTLQYTWLHFTGSPQAEVRMHSLGFSLGTVQLHGALYF